MLRKLAQGLLSRMTEIVLSLILVLVSFAAILALLSWSFPQGLTLAQLMKGERSSLLNQGRAGRRYDVSQQASGGSTVPQSIAVLSRLHRRVKDKPAQAISWSESRAGLPLYDRHSIQTYSRSGATILFDGGAQLELDENTLIVLRGVRREATGNRQASLVVLDGEFRATLADTDGTRTRFEVVLPNGTADLSGTDGKGTFHVSVNEDKSATIAVRDGTAAVEINGASLQINPDQALTIAADGSAGPPVALPPPPTTEGPEDARTITYRSTPPRVEFHWDAEAGADSYELQIASDPEFTEILHEEKLEGTEFTHGNLRDGTYYWRVMGRNGWAVGNPSETRVLAMRQDVVPPALAVTFPESAVESDRWTLRGSTEPGAQIFVGDSEVAVAADGSFEHVLELEPGINVVVVEAVDDAGNISYQSQLVKATY